MGLVFWAGLAQAETAFVQKVIDARTLQLIDGETVRLIGVEDPALQSEHDAKAAKDFVRGLVSGGLVELEYDVEKRDADGHLLAYVWFITPDNAQAHYSKFPEDFKVNFKVNNEGYDAFFVFLNATVIKAGHAIPSKSATNLRHTELFEQLYQDRVLTSAKLDVGEAPQILAAEK